MSNVKQHWWDRLNGALVPYLGPPQLGPYDEAPQQPASEKACPLCGAVMSAHEIDRAPGRPSYVHCP